MKYLALCRLRVQHSRYADGLCTDLAIEPTPATQQLLARHRLRLQPRPDGLALWAEARADGKAALLPLARDAVLGFALRPTDPAFAQYTDLSELSGKTDPVFSNAGLGAADPRVLRLIDRKRWQVQPFVAPAAAAPLRLALVAPALALNGDARRPLRAADFDLGSDAGGARVTAYDAPARAVTVQAAAAGQALALRYRLRPAPRHGTLAEVELHANRSLQAAGADGVPFEIRFQARALRWAYYLVTDHAGDFAIVDGAASAPIAFSAPGLALDAAAAETDPFAATLAIQYPGHRRIRFLSDQPVPCSSLARKGLALVQGDHRVLEALPNASRPSRLRLPAAGPAQDQDCLCQVIKVLKSR